MQNSHQKVKTTGCAVFCSSESLYNVDDRFLGSNELLLNVKILNMNSFHSG